MSNLIDTVILSERRTDVKGLILAMRGGGEFLSIVRIADHILVLEQGQITEERTHERLLSAQGTYANLFNLQVAGYS